MRIGFISGEFPPQRGGVGDYTCHLTQHLADRGLDIHILSHCEARLSDERIVDECIRLHPRISHWGGRALLQSRAWADEWKLDLVHLQYQTAAYGMSPWVHFLPQFLRPPTITTFHDLRAPYLFPKAGPLRDLSVRWLARSSSGIILTGPKERESLAPHPHSCEIPVGSNILAPLPADFDTVSTRAKYAARRDDFVLAHFGFAHESKGFTDLLAVLSHLRQSGVPTILWFIGALLGDADRQNRVALAQLQEEIDRLGLAPWVRMSGYLEEDQVRAALTAADVVVLPYRDGAAYHHGSLQAALHAGCAIVTTRPQNTATAFQDGVNLRLVPVADVPALTTALHDLFLHPEKREVLQAGALALAAEFSWENIARRHETFYREMQATAR